MSILEGIDRVLDPLNLLGLRGTEADKRAIKLQNEKAKYRKLWNEGEKKGYPMELLGFPKPETELLSAGLGGGAGGAPIGGPSLLPPIVPTTSARTTESEVKEEEKKVEEIENTLEELSSDTQFERD